MLVAWLSLAAWKLAQKTEGYISTSLTATNGQSIFASGPASKVQCPLVVASSHSPQQISEFCRPQPECTSFVPWFDNVLTVTKVYTLQRIA